MARACWDESFVSRVKSFPHTGNLKLKNSFKKVHKFVNCVLIIFPSLTGRINPKITGKSVRAPIPCYLIRRQNIDVFCLLFQGQLTIVEKIMDLLTNVVWLIVAYLIGSLPTGYIVAKRVRGIDIRREGSGNIGATNVFRVMGSKWGSVVLAIDILKGWAVTAVLAPTASAFVELSPPLKQFLFAAAAIAGHTWTPWLKLKGGKGIATSAGALLGIFPFATLTALFIWLLCFLIWHYVSLASIIAATSFPVLLLIFERRLESFPIIWWISLFIVALLIYNHRSNINRLRRGEEPRVNFGKDKSEPSN